MGVIGTLLLTAAIAGVVGIELCDLIGALDLVMSLGIVSDA